MVSRPDPAAATPAQWRAYLYLRANTRGWATETWYHRMGCRRFITVQRHTETHEIRAAWPAGAEPQGGPGLTGPVRMGRLPRQPGEVIDRDGSLSFTWNGRAYPAYPGDTIISRAAAAGERVFSRSLKYHRPRGLLTASFHDPGCMVQVGDEPNVRGAHRLVTDGMRVPAAERLALASGSTPRP